MTKFLTYAPISKKIRADEYEELSFLAYACTSSISIKAKWYRSGGTTQTYTYTGTISSGKITAVISKPGGETLSSTSRIEVWGEYNGSIVTEVRTLIPDLTPRKNPVRLGWMNTLGGIDHYTFTGAKAVETFAERIAFTRDLPAPFAVHDRGQGVASVTAYDEWEVISDFESSDVYQWLSGLLISREVWIDEITRIRPIVLTTKSHPILSDNLFQMKIKFRLANDKVVQHG